MSNLRLTRAYTCDGCGPMGESHPHTLTVDFAYASMTVAVQREWPRPDGARIDRVIYTWEEWNAMREIANQERRDE